MEGSVAKMIVGRQQSAKIQNYLFEAHRLCGRTVWPSLRHWRCHNQLQPVGAGRHAFQVGKIEFKHLDTMGRFIDPVTR
jgi:hypothetical protein